MGIKGLHQVIKKYAEDVYVQRHLSEYAYKRIAVDISLYLFKYKAIFRERWISAFISLIACFRKHDIHCVFIFDGKAPKEKEEERRARAESRDKLENKVEEIEHDIEEFERSGEISDLLQKVWTENKSAGPPRLLGGSSQGFSIKIVKEYLDRIKGQVIRITEDDFIKARELFDLLQVPYIKAEGEAESFASHLCVRGLVDAVASEDTDVLAYGTPIFVTKINTSDETCVEINYSELLERMGLTPEMFTDLCIMCGTDYNTNIRGIGPDKALKLLVDRGSIEEIAQITDSKTGEAKFDISCLKHERVRELFSVPERLEVRIPYCGKPDFVKLRKWIWSQGIRYNVESIVANFQPRELTFDD